MTFSPKKKRNVLSPFVLRVLTVVASIPKGKCLSYKDVASRAGSPGASRSVGSIMSKNHDPSVPCHRVVHSNGFMGCYNGFRGEKLKLLTKEGVAVSKSGMIDQSAFDW